MLKDLLSQSAKQFDRLIYETADSLTDRDGNVEQIDSSNFRIGTERIKAFQAAQISSAFALAEAQGIKKGEQSGIKKAVELLEKQISIDKHLRSEVVGSLGKEWHDGKIDACERVLEALQSNLTTKKD